MRIFLRLFPLVFALLFASTAEATITYFVSATGNDASTGTIMNPLRTLEGARAKLEALYPGLTVNQNVNIYILGNVNIEEGTYSGANRVDWSISGTASYPINIIGAGGFRNSSLNRNPADAAGNGYMIRLHEADYVTIRDLTFNDATVGIWINSSDHCSINNNRFVGNVISTTGGAGSIAITRSLASEHLSRYNDVVYNIFYNTGPSSVTGLTNDYPGAFYYHAIYIAQCAYNKVNYNTIIAPPAAGIHYYHGYSQNNQVTGNVINECYKTRKNFGALAWGIIVGVSDGGGIDGDASTIFGNSNTYNHIGANKVIPNTSSSYTDIDGTIDFVINNALVGSNPSFGGNRTHHANYNWNNYPMDPYWVEFDVQTIEGRTVTGDFDGDGGKDDIAVIKDMGDGSSQIHVWLSLRAVVADPLTGYAGYEADDAFFYQGSWWTSNPGAYNANMVTGRVVAGDFNNDGIDDIAAMYDYGNNHSRIHTWINSGSNSFGPYSWANTWWTAGSGYNANMVTDRFVCGDFNDDGKDDVAAMYDYGNGHSRIHTWISNGSSFSPNGYAYTWWQANNGSTYDANKVTGRFVCGDYNGDGKDDIAAMYDYGSNHSRIHTWMSNGSSFSPSGYANTWWVAGSGYNANKVTGRFVSGDFDGNGRCDLAAMYDYGSNNSRIHYWTSTGSSFGPSGYAYTGWTSSPGGYATSKVGSRFLAGEFSNGNEWDVMAFYDYSTPAMQRTRTHVWEKGSTFWMPTSLGYVWMMDDTELGIDCNNWTKSAEEEQDDFAVLNPVSAEMMRLEVYPNPATINAEVRYALSGGKPWQLVLINMQGQTISVAAGDVSQAGSYTEMLTFSDLELPAGVYIVQLREGDETPLTKKLVVVR